MDATEPDRRQVATADAGSSFSSILGPGSPASPTARAVEVDVLNDLRLDRVVASIVAGREDYDLTPILHAPVWDLDTIAYRHEVFRDLADPSLVDLVQAFASAMQAMRDRLSRSAKAYYPYERERWFLDAADVYVEAVMALSRALTDAKPSSRGFRGLRDYLAHYTASDRFTSLVRETDEVKADLAEIRYRLHILGPKIRVSRYEADPDYGAEVLATFEKFKQGSPKDYHFELSSWPQMNHVEAAVLERVAWLYPQAFGRLDQYCEHHRDYLDQTVRTFDRAIQFYLAYLDYIERFKRAGLAFCYPEISGESKEIRGRDVFDLALADGLVRVNAPVVTNDFDLEGRERILVVSGPNQGGKTTFARTIGQLHYLAGLGCPVPGSAARLYKVDQIFTHFEREEDLANLSGTLEDDLRRIKRILDAATPRSLLVMNESFSSTTLSDQLFLNREVIRRIIACDLICVAVTFLDELSTLGDTTVSMVSTVDPNDPARRTFKIIRRVADGRAYAWAIAQKYGLTYERVRTRLSR